MNKDSTNCKANKASGERCTRKARASGYCKIHEKKKILDRKIKQYNDVVGVIYEVCEMKGWYAYLTSKDSGLQFVEVQISKKFGMNDTEAMVYATIDDGVKLNCEQTSFHGHGITDIQSAISLKLRELSWLVSKKKNKPKVEELVPSKLILILLKNFHRSAHQIKRRYNRREPFLIEDEYDAQDFLHAMLRAYFNDVRPEEYTPSYAGSSSRVDFLLKPEKSIIEVKFATENLREKRISEELIIDIKKYQTHPDCKFLYCLVYDPEGIIRNPVGFEDDLSGKHNNLPVTVLVVPH